MASRRFQPERALLHPLWIGALLVLVVNDHVLKGAGILPGALTGKLSDFAGLVVAPLVLATVLRVRSRRHFAMANLATGAGFAALQLWQGAGDALAFFLATTADPSDLFALAVLPLSFLVLARAAEATSARKHARRSVQWSAAGVGLFACMGTSPPERPVFYADFWSDVYIHNPTGEETVVLVRTLRTDIEIDCLEISQRPGELLTEDLFDNARSWAVPPTAAVPVRPDNPWDEPEVAQECYAAWIMGDTLNPHLAFWMANALPSENKPGNIFNEDEYTSGALVLEMREDGNGFTLGDRDGDLLFAPTAPVDPSGPACEFPSDAGRLDWSVPLPVGEFNLDQVKFGGDGCAELEMGTTRWYLCVPPEVFPFTAGEAVRIAELSGQGAVAGTYEAIVLRGLDQVGGVTDGRELIVSRGSGVPKLWDFGITVGGTCEQVAEDSCGTVARNVSLTLVGAGTVTQAPTGSIITDLASPMGGTANISVRHAQSRTLVDPACALGPGQLGNDLEVAASHSYGP